MYQFNMSLEMTGLDLHDSRLNDRCIKLLKSFDKHPIDSIPSACQTQAETKAAYRFFKNPKVVPEKLLEPHIQAAKERCKAQSIVLFLEDTTEVDLTGNSSLQRLGRLDHEDRKGMYCHAGLAVTKEGLPLGILKVHFFDRVKNPISHTRNYRQTSLEQKESFRWVQGIRDADALAKELPNTKIIYIADRESDIFPCLFEATQKETSCAVILRAYKNRNTTTKIPGSCDKFKKLFSVLEEYPEHGEISFQTQSGHGKKSRLVTQTIRFGKVEIRPEKTQKTGYHRISINAVMLKEKNAPPNVKAVDWVLLTTLPVDTVEEALMIVQLYTKRWRIETFFKILKLYCHIEELKLIEAPRIKACTTLYMIIAWRLLLLQEIGKEYGEEPCTLAFTDLEWKIVCLSILRKQKKGFDKLSKTPPILNEFIKMLASLGGFLGRKGDPPPGPKCICLGFIKMQALVEGWELCQSAQSCG